ncbi:DUF3187 family protein [Shewanella gelidii]|uniref:DUF3187 family protein n=1 Tax=Shewanella gelidii TaxID=1642821 RepID=UPI00166C4737|nr:DUF3187 family protein [Shewanella gelidii]MCL1097655.1 DUF3187 family protein [Shewanella gelidii]
MKFTSQLSLVFLFTYSASAAVVAKPDASSSDFGPLLIRAQAPLQSSSVSTKIRNAFQSVNHEVYASASMASIWAINDDYTMDYYQNDLQFGGQYAFESGTKIELTYLYRFAANNHLDSLSIAFHDAIGLGQNGREDVDKHRFVIDAPNYIDAPITDFANETLNNVWELYFEQNLYQSAPDSLGAHHALSLGATLFYNYVGHGPFADHSFEQSAQLNYSVNFDHQHYLYTLASLSHRDSTDIENFRFKEWTYSLGAGYQYRYDDKHSFLAEMQIYEGIARDLEDLKESVYEFTLGYRYHYKQGAFEIAMIENVINADNSADIAFTFAYRHRL